MPHATGMFQATAAATGLLAARVAVAGKTSASWLTAQLGGADEDETEQPVKASNLGSSPRFSLDSACWSGAPRLSVDVFSASFLFFFLRPNSSYFSSSESHSFLSLFPCRSKNPPPFPMFVQSRFSDRRKNRPPPPLELGTCLRAYRDTTPGSPNFGSSAKAPLAPGTARGDTREGADAACKAAASVSSVSNGTAGVVPTVTGAAAVCGSASVGAETAGWGSSRDLSRLGPISESSNARASSIHQLGTPPPGTTRPRKLDAAA
mmetsp:Transcript_45192/g.86938  ORF Transcript_45192/g.86938 Transcript_45192/m.86938 type:complete len:263 (-) Transcript_45192:3-791(-)